MAIRPVFIIKDKAPFFDEKMVDFKFYSGFAEIQKKKSIGSLHESFLSKCPKSKVLEISSKSEDELGIKLSAFNLMIETKAGKRYSVESAFQSSKVFELGGPYTDLLEKSSLEAKKDERLKNSGKIKYFEFRDRRFELIPTTYFYNWLYINTLNLHTDLAEQLMEYDAFTDIVFNPEKSINCQARAAAVFVSLRKSGLLDEALLSKDAFLETVYRGNISINDFNIEQLSIWG